MSIVQTNYKTFSTQFMKDEAFFKTLGSRIADLRKQAGLSQAQLAKLLGTKQQSWATYEKATRRLPASYLVPLAEVFEVSVEEILGVTDRPRKRGPAPKLSLQFEAISKLPKGDQKFFSQMIERFLKEQAAA